MLQIGGLEARVLGDTSEHLWPNFFRVMERENEIRPAIAA